MCFTSNSFLKFREYNNSCDLKVNLYDLGIVFDVFFRNYLVVFSFKDGKSGSMSEVLKDHTIFTGNCDFHIIPFFNYQALPRQRSGNYPAFFEKETAYASKRCLLAM